MSNFLPDQAQEKALASWYTENNPLRLDPRHPLIKLAGEAGEILDLYGKHEYKPNFSWWKCKSCGFIPMDKGKQHDYVAYTRFNGERQHNSLVLDELGDYSYYLRILTYQQEVSFEMLCEGFESTLSFLEILLNDLAFYSTRLHRTWLKTQRVDGNELQALTFIFLSILENLEVSLEEVLNLNYKKLNSEETQHGWSAAR